jgi:LEA14-like dessication related protein
MMREAKRGRNSKLQKGWGRWAATSTVMLVLGAGLVFTACTSMGSLEPPSVSLAGVELSEVTVFETTVQVKLRVSNPNPEPMTLEGASFKLRLEDHKIGRGLSSEIVTIERLDTALLNVTFYVNNAVALLQLREILQQEAVDYRVQAVLYTQGSWGTKKLKVDKEGRFEFTNPVELNLEE